MSSTPFYPFPSFFKGVILPLLIWLMLTPWLNQIDLKMSHLFYKNHVFISHPFWDWLYIYGTWPAWSLVGLALIGLGVSFHPAYRIWLKPSLFLVLTLALGAGLVIHVIFKENWGRPRPRQVIEFGGSQPFHSYYHPNIYHQLEPSKSFPSGHASTGYYFFCLSFLGIFYRSSILYWLGLSMGFGLGIALSFARIAQGGHFFSDTLASALIMWLTAWVLAYFFLNKRRLT